MFLMLKNYCKQVFLTLDMVEVWSPRKIADSLFRVGIFINNLEKASSYTHFLQQLD